MAKNAQYLTPREAAQQTVKSARTDILLVVILTIVNIAMLIGGIDYFMLFSASVPYYAVCFPALMGEYELFVLGVILAVIIIIAYFLCWLLSKKRPQWLTVALVMFIVDTIGLIGFYILAQEISGIMDLLIHALVLYQLIRGIQAANKLKKMPVGRELRITVRPFAAWVKKKNTVFCSAASMAESGSSTEESSMSTSL